jgi:CheY-like chemotaxis protein
VNVLVAARLLQRLGCDVETVTDSRDAVEQVLASMPDIVLMDVQMPIKDGLQVTRELRDKGFTNPIVALTATAFQQDRDACREAGMDDFLAKPIRSEDLASVLDRFSARFAS